jgi:hypothetical protein
VDDIPGSIAHGTLNGAYLDPDWVASLPPDAQQEAQWWQVQTRNGFCAPTSVAMVVSEFYGQPIDAGWFVSEAIDEGLLVPDANGEYSGLTLEQTEQLMESFDVPATTVHFDDRDQAEAQLRQALDNNQGVVAFIDSSETWDRVDDDAEVDGGYIDHAVVITDIEGGFVYISDPGNPTADAMRVPEDVFFDAWGDSDGLGSYGAVITDAAPATSDLAQPDLTSPDLELEDATRAVDAEVQPAIRFDAALSESGSSIWLLPIRLVADMIDGLA